MDPPRGIDPLLGRGILALLQLPGKSLQAVFEAHREPGFQGMYVNVPMLGITSIGAGTGTYIRVDPATNRIDHA